MAAIQKLSNPPILEALIDFRFNVPEGVRLESLDNLRSDLSDAFPIREEQHQLEFAFGAASTNAPQTAKDDLVGYVLRSADKRKAIVLRRNGCSASHAGGYSSWEALQADAVDLLGRFVRATCAEAVTRVAARYINQIRLAEGQVDIDELLVHGPQVPDGVRNQLFMYQSLLGIDDEQTGLQAVVRQGLVEEVSGKSLAIMIDSDVYKAATFEPNYDALSETLAAIRDLKNRIFFGSLHERALEPFK